MPPAGTSSGKCPPGHSTAAAPLQHKGHDHRMEGNVLTPPVWGYWVSPWTVSDLDRYVVSRSFLNIPFRGRKTMEEGRVSDRK